MKFTLSWLKTHWESDAPLAAIVDKLSMIGGMLGLFTGFSIISFYEIVFWGMKGLSRAISEKRGD